MHFETIACKNQVKTRAGKNPGTRTTKIHVEILSRKNPGEEITLETIWKQFQIWKWLNQNNIKKFYDY
ncbi:hypothetical protein HYD53_03745 [Mycoplasmopsis bovis]|nr:hypothetical protein [Mycoplasmopsis bovis]QQH72165.1 hypothetical protein HYD53_03745 [Mycoplasmopsis bovis]